MKTILEVIESGTAYLEKHGIGEARLTMQHLVGHILGLSRVQLYMEFDRPLNEEQLAPIREGLRRRSQGVPFQHLAGKVEFLRREFLCDGRALIPRPETEELVGLILAEKTSLPEKARILDVGTGSGVIGLSLASELPGAGELVLADLSPQALALARENAAAHHVETTFLESDLFSAVEGTFDLVVANLPYVAESERGLLAPELAHEPEMALFSGPDGLTLLRRFAAEVGDYLNPGGRVALEVGHDQGEAVAQLLMQFSLTDIDIRADLSGVFRFLFARKG